MTFDPAAETWRDEAACRTEGTALFFPKVPNFGRNRAGAIAARHEADETAKAVCRTCPVQVECLSYALVHRQDDGIWGGTTPDERAGMDRPRRPRRVKPINHGTVGGASSHRKRGERMCDPCRFAWNQHAREEAKAKREASA